MSMTVPILYEDENYLVINKPAGLVVHADGRTEEPSLTDWILEKYPEIKDVGEPWQNPAGITSHRMSQKAITSSQTMAPGSATRMFLAHTVHAHQPMKNESRITQPICAASSRDCNTM